MRLFTLQTGIAARFRYNVLYFVARKGGVPRKVPTVAGHGIAAGARNDTKDAAAVAVTRFAFRRIKTLSSSRIDQTTFGSPETLLLGPWAPASGSGSQLRGRQTQQRPQEEACCQVLDPAQLGGHPRASSMLHRNGWLPPQELLPLPHLWKAVAHGGE